jgi:hypothetical protein
MKLLTIFLSFCLLFSCYSAEKKEPVNENLVGNWAFIDSNGKYSEIYIESGSLSIYNEEFCNSLGVMNYNIKNDSLHFNGLSYFIEAISCDRVNLGNQENNLLLDRISVLEPDTINSINPFYLRRCSYLVDNGIISVKDAIQYLNSLLSDEIKPEKTIPII